MSAADVIARHRAAGREFEAGGVRSFVREAGSGQAVVCMHGVPSSCFLYRKVLDELAARGLRGVAFDLPGLGLAERPAGYDYTWTGLGRFAIAAVDALGLDGFHLVVHDIGGPVGLELAAAMPERVRSITVLNTLVCVDGFRRPLIMAPFAVPVLGELWLATSRGPAFAQLMYYTAIGDRSAITKDELGAYAALVRRADGGRAFLKIMRSFELTRAKQELYTAALRDHRYAVQIVWGADDPVLTLAKHGEQARAAAGLDEIHALPAKHFLQEDQAPAIADRVAEIADAKLPDTKTLDARRLLEP
ncbi:MAG: alpha/beta fold hydrolase [Thermoleophilaceae bacterium]